MKTHWMSEIDHARNTKHRHGITGPWYTYAKQQANRQVRRNAQVYIGEGLDEFCFADAEESTLAQWERDDQVALMNANQHILRAALNFACRLSSGWDASEGDWDAWDIDGITIAYDERGGIYINVSHHDFVWNAFKLFL